MRNATIIIISSLVLCTFAANAQTTERTEFTIYAYTMDEDEENKVEEHYCLADIDVDGVADTLRYDITKTRFTFLLSTLNFVPIQACYDLREGGDKATVWGSDGCFHIAFDNRRAWSSESYFYEHEKQRFRLMSFWHESYGDAHNNYDDDYGCCWTYHREYSLNFLSARFEASLSYYRQATDSSISYPNIEMYVENYPVYLGDSTEWYMPDLDDYEKEYIAPHVDTVRFIRFAENGDYENLLGEMNGGRYSTIVGNVYVEPNKGDIVEGNVSTVCLQEPGDKSIFYVRRVISDIKVIKEGKLSQFYKRNKKPIRYFGVHTEHWRTETRCPSEMDYFLANTKHKSIRKHLKKSAGSLEIEFFEYEGESPEADVLVEIKHKHKGKTILLAKLLLEVIHTNIANFYVFDEKKQAYLPWNNE